MLSFDIVGGSFLYIFYVILKTNTVRI